MDWTYADKKTDSNTHVAVHKRKKKRRRDNNPRVSVLDT